MNVCMRELEFISKIDYDKVKEENDKLKKEIEELKINRLLFHNISEEDEDDDDFSKFLKQAKERKDKLKDIYLKQTEKINSLKNAANILNELIQAT